MPNKILLADDSMTAQKMGKEILTAAGYEVVAVSNGAAAAKKLADKYSVIILDINMPGYTGLELCEKIRANMDIAKTPVLLTIGKMEHYEPTEVQRVKADGVIIKPFEATDLVATVQKLEQKMSAAKSTPDYEKTVIFKAADIQEFKDQSYNEWKESEEPAAPPKKTMEMSTADASAPAFGMDMEAETATAPADVAPAVRAYEAASASVADAPTMDFPPPAAFEATSGAELTPVESRNIESLLQGSTEPVSMEPEPHVVSIAPPTFTAGGRDPNFETSDSESSSPDYAIPAKDPALAAPEEMTAPEFVAKSSSEPATAATDAEFEARVAAAMSTGYEHAEEIVEPELEVTHSEPVQEMVAQAASTSTSEPAPMAEPPDYERTVKIQARPDLEISSSPVEAAVAGEEESLEIVPDPLIERLSDPVPEPVAPPSAPDPALVEPTSVPDQVLVEQMNAAFANLPVETTPHIVEEPVAVPEPGAEVAPPPPPPSRTTGHDLELASALAAAVGAEGPSTMAAAAGATPSPNATIVDPQLIAAAVHRAMARMMPALMTEVAKELDPEKK